MKKRIALIVVLQLSVLFSNCSSDSGDDTTPPVEVVKAAKINSYSKNYGQTGETITMYGENFSANTNDIKLAFDGAPVEILSATATEIKFNLPQTEKLLPKVTLTIGGKEIVNEVKNDYEGNIGVLPIPSTTGWFTIENILKGDRKIYKIQILNDKVLYYSMADIFGSGVYRTLDGGITWKYRWGSTGASGIFFATKNDEGWADTMFGIQKVPIGGSEKMDIIKSTEGDSYYAIYVDDNMKNGTIVTQLGKVFTTNNGIDFTKIYDTATSNDALKNLENIAQSVVIDNDHIWAIGHKIIKDVNGFSGNRPFILFKNNTTDGWKEYPFVKEGSNYYAREISFVDTENGFLLINNYITSDVKLFKTINGGDSWLQVYNGEKFTKFAFKDANTGWAILDNKIYKTTNGASTWVLDYTHDQPIRNISYKNNVVWAFSTDKIIKRNL
ncbi:IPT/TIG domain-containing protein [Flavobacterium sp. ALJ2]|uniref:IPT/TIG domain-containing protein n=1 Tax=Flavobacterium sp. ALJ2 TaxID=2786960 RepID=UPI0018A11C44|nr:IPT/TIG domain-containing protein [Flavobacterium sp. ALJ2]MBF7093170.1 IPT/TIG domain-containing protein [Flavobacterium sp. ALJ2]